MAQTIAQILIAVWIVANMVIGIRVAKDEYACAGHMIVVALYFAVLLCAGAFTRIF